MRAGNDFNHQFLQPQSVRRGRHGRRSGKRTGFTLMETALAIVIVGTGVLSIMYAQLTFHRQNDWSTHSSTATFLANEIREMTVKLPAHDPVTGTSYWGPESNEYTLADFDDLDDFDGTAGLGTMFSAADGTGPVNAMRQVIPNMQGWAQIVKVYNVPENDISAPGDSQLDGQTPITRVEVSVTYQGPNDTEPTEVVHAEWISDN